jgi:hypothetical protein
MQTETQFTGTVLVAIDATYSVEITVTDKWNSFVVARSSLFQNWSVVSRHRSYELALKAAGTTPAFSVRVISFQNTATNEPLVYNPSMRYN